RSGRYYDPDSVESVALIVFSAFFIFLVSGFLVLRFHWLSGLRGHWGLPWSRLSLTRLHSQMDYGGWTLQTLDGKTVPPGDLEGKVLFINFWATWCVPCRLEMGSIERLGEHFKEDKNIAFLMASDEDPHIVKDFLRKHPMPIPIYVYRGTLPPVL